jgi:hypothetical protein
MWSEASSAPRAYSSFRDSPRIWSPVKDSLRSYSPLRETPRSMDCHTGEIQMSHFTGDYAIELCIWIIGWGNCSFRFACDWISEVDHGGPSCREYFECLEDTDCRDELFLLPERVLDMDRHGGCHERN